MNEQFVVIGLGSMGKRRVRCLLSLGVKPENIWGMDTREDRRHEAAEKYGIHAAENESEVDFGPVRGVIVSLPPDKHALGVNIALRHQKPAFIEASVVLKDVRKIEADNKNKVFLAPSCTMAFHPMIREIKQIVQEKRYGSVCNFSYHSGQYLPDWHPWEDVKDFYVSNRETGGAREIVPFEMTWIADVFGLPKGIKGYFRKTGNIGCDIEDSYACCLDYGAMTGTLLVDVVSRFATRNLIINFERAQLRWAWENKRIELYEADTQEWKYIRQEEQRHESGYNANIIEDMYVDEIRKFLAGIEDEKMYPNTIGKDIAILELLEALEESDGGFAKDR